MTLDKPTRAHCVKVFGTPSRVSKMPGACSPSLPPSSCPIGCKLRKLPTSPCHKCYAERLRKAYPSAARAWTRNLRALRRALKDAPLHYATTLITTEHYPHPFPRIHSECCTCAWIACGAVLLRDEAQRAGDDRVRWQVAGDIQSEEHARMIYDVCRLTPELSHRLPTLEAIIVRHLADREAIHPPANLKLTLSLPRCNVSRSSCRDFPTSNVWTRDFLATHPPDGWVCPAVLNHTPCGKCRACWPGPESQAHVIYPQH